MKRFLINTCFGLNFLLWVLPASAQYEYETSAGYYEYGGSAAFGTPSQSDGWTARAASQWVSRYMQRGYQQFGNNGAFGIMLGGGYGPVGAGIEQRWADGGGDREFRGTLRAKNHFQGLDVKARATYINFSGDDPANWDLGLGVGGNLFMGIRWETEIYYGTEPSNFYWDAGISREWEIAGAWSVSTSAGLGANLGYQREAPKGVEHAAFGLDIARALGPRSAVFGGVDYYAPINRDETRYKDHSDLYDGFVFQLGARWRY